MQHGAIRRSYEALLRRGTSPARVEYRVSGSNMSAPQHLQGEELRIAICGGPAAGKSTLCDILRKEYGSHIAYVPEVATIIIGGGLPRHGAALRCLQRAIYTTQREYEDAQRLTNPGRILLCDRASLDSAIFWPEGPSAFFKEVGSSLEAELARYDAVLFLDTVGCSDLPLLLSPSDGANPLRIESSDACCQQNQLLYDLYRQHPRFYHVPVQTSFVTKLNEAQRAFERIVSELRQERACQTA